MKEQFKKHSISTKNLERRKHPLSTKPPEGFVKVKGTNGKYFVNRLGKMWTAETYIKDKNGFIRVYSARELHLSNSHGYRCVRMRVNGKTKTYRVNRIVAETFIPKVKGKIFVNHINSVRSDDRVENLEWCTPRENVQHALKMGAVQVGEKAYNAKLTNASVKEMRELYKSGMTLTELSNIYKVCLATVFGVVRRNKWKHI